jgi:hypothetical protein
VTSSSARSSSSTPRTPCATGGIVIGDLRVPSTAACNTCLLRPKKEAGSSGTSNVWVKEEADAPPPSRVRVKKEKDDAPPLSLKKTRHGRDWQAPWDYATRSSSSRYRTIQRSSLARGWRSTPPSMRSSRGSWSSPSPGPGRTHKRRAPPRPLRQP